VNPLLAQSTDQTIREQPGCNDQKFTRSLMKCANSWRGSVSSTNALINELVAKAKTSNTAGNVSTSVMSSSKAKEDIVDCHWCNFVYCFFSAVTRVVSCCYFCCCCFVLFSCGSRRRTRDQDLGCDRNNHSHRFLQSTIDP
jgi:hypothetical protein